jgi:hypothetical protein
MKYLREGDPGVFDLAFDADITANIEATDTNAMAFGSAALTTVFDSVQDYSAAPLILIYMFKIRFGLADGSPLPSEYENIHTFRGSYAEQPKDYAFSLSSNLRYIISENHELYGIAPESGVLELTIKKTGYIDAEITNPGLRSVLVRAGAGKNIEIIMGDHPARTQPISKPGTYQVKGLQVEKRRSSSFR